MRFLISRQPKLALGVKIALAFLAHGKVHGATVAPGTFPIVPDFGSLLPRTVLRKAFKKEVVIPSGQTETASSSAGSTLIGGGIWIQAEYAPMTYEQARLWLQAYNAGPHALLKYKGHVPYRETRNYVPRVMKYYTQKLDESPYDKHIVASAAKYGLDPQLIRAVMKAESDFNNKTTSHAGARGLMQVMPVVWSHVKKKYGMEWNYSGGVFEPAKNVEVACMYLAWLRYDFLPRHFADFEKNPEAPSAVVRDKGVPARTAPRILVKAPEIPVAEPYKQAVAAHDSDLQPLAVDVENQAARTAAALFSTFTVSSSSVETGEKAAELKESIVKKATELRDEAVEKFHLRDVVVPAEPLKKKRGRLASRDKLAKGHSS